ncbi:MAG TPA: hypothetical protein VMD74_03915 [Candidatus Methylomirabilis sp.]|nr:hypothetical protein [Candidatus Methylomirabilis sp.]
MIILILLVVIGGMFALYLGRRNAITGNEGAKIVWATIRFRCGIAIAGMFVGSLIWLIVSLLAGVALPHRCDFREYDNLKLIAVKSSASQAGSFFLGSGIIDGARYCEFYSQAADGGKHYGKVLAENTTVYEEERSDGYLAALSSHPVFSRWINYWLIPSGAYDACTDKYSIHVPKGTVKPGFDLGL